MTPTIKAVGALLASTLICTPALAQQNYGATSAAPQTTAQPAAQVDQSATIKTHMPKVSHDAGKAIQALQASVNAKNAAEIPAKLAAAQAVAKTNDDRYVIGLLQLKAGADAKNNAQVAAGIEAMLASGSVTQEEKYPLYLTLGETYSDMKQYDRAATALQQAAQLNPSSVEVVASLAEARAAQGQPKAALALLQKGIKLQQAGGQKAPEAWYKRAVQVAYKAKLPDVLEISREWVQAYPSSSSWTNALAIYQNSAALDEATTLDLMRLKRAAGALTPADYFNYGDIAVRKGFSGEAKSVLEQGFNAKVIDRNDPSFKQLYALATQKTKGDRESLPKSPDGLTAQQALVNGDAYFGYGDYATAAQFYRAALGKSGADSSLVNLHLGMALAREGDKTAASTALKAVSGTEGQIAKYWLTYLSASA